MARSQKAFVPSSEKKRFLSSRRKDKSAYIAFRILVGGMGLIWGVIIPVVWFFQRRLVVKYRGKTAKKKNTARHWFKPESVPIHSGSSVIYLL